MKIDEAEREIARILAALEVKQGCIVKEVEIVSLDGTGFNDTRVQMYRHVRINLEIVPGSNWAT